MAVTFENAVFVKCRRKHQFKKMDYNEVQRFRDNPKSGTVVEAYIKKIDQPPNKG